MKTNTKLLILAVAVLSVTVLLGSYPISQSDESDAATDIAVLDVRDLSGHSISGKGAILDNTSLNPWTYTAPGESAPNEYVVEAGTVLVGGSLYLLVDSQKTFSYSLSASIFNFNSTAQVFGLRFSLYADRDCSGEAVASTVFDSDSTNERIVADSLVSNTQYYIKVDTVHRYDSSSAPSVADVGFSFTASLDTAYHAVYYVSDGETVASTLLRNGDRYTFPDLPSKEGYTFIGWYDSLSYDRETGKYPVLYRSTDVVNLDDDLTLYAFWWAGGSEDFHYETLDGDTVDIHVVVSDSGVTVAVEAASSDGATTIDLEPTDISGRNIPVTVRTNLSDGEAYSVERAEDASELIDLISVWMDAKGLVTDPTVVLDDTSADATIGSLQVLEENGIGLKVGSGDTSVGFDDDALKGIVNEAVRLLTGSYPSGTISPTVLSSVLGRVIREATALDLAPKQVSEIGNDDAWYVAVTLNGEEVHNTGGTVTVTVPFDTRYDDPTVRARYVADDGSVEYLDTDFDGTTARFTAGHLSIFAVSVTHDSSSGTGLSLWVLIIVVTVVLSVALTYFPPAVISAYFAKKP